MCVIIRCAKCFLCPMCSSLLQVRVEGVRGGRLYLIYYCSVPNLLMGMNPRRPHLFQSTMMVKFSFLLAATASGKGLSVPAFASLSVLNCLSSWIQYSLYLAVSVFVSVTVFVCASVFVCLSASRYLSVRLSPIRHSLRLTRLSLLRLPHPSVFLFLPEVCVCICILYQGVLHVAESQHPATHLRVCVCVCVVCVYC